jgi:hypothetical protein
MSLVNSGNLTFTQPGGAFTDQPTRTFPSRKEFDEYWESSSGIEDGYTDEFGFGYGDDHGYEYEEVMWGGGRGQRPRGLEREIGEGESCISGGFVEGEVFIEVESEGDDDGVYSEDMMIEGDEVWVESEDEFGEDEYLEEEGDWREEREEDVWIERREWEKEELRVDGDEGRIEGDGFNIDMERARTGDQEGRLYVGGGVTPSEVGGFEDEVLGTEAVEDVFVFGEENPVPREEMDQIIDFDASENKFDNEQKSNTEQIEILEPEYSFELGEPFHLREEISRKPSTNISRSTSRIFERPSVSFFFCLLI